MIFLEFKPFTAPHRQKFKDPDTGYQYEGNSRDELVRKIKGYRSQNGLPPIELLNRVIDHYQCSLPENVGRCISKPLERSVLGTLKGGIALLKNMAFKNYVSQSQADLRAGTCLKCPFNIFPDKKGFVEWSDKIATASVGERRSIHHDKLGNCGVCSCPLRSKVFYGDTLKLTDKELERMPDYCWQKVEINKKKVKVT